MAARLSLTFVLVEYNSTIVRGYYSLSNFSIIFTDLPKPLQKRLPKYPQVGATLLGRLAVDRQYSKSLQKSLGHKPGLGKLLLFDAQCRMLKGITDISASMALVVDVLQPSDAELQSGLRDPMSFYLQYGFLPFPGNARRVYKLTKTIEREFAT
jgi:hypothetical protein